MLSLITAKIFSIVGSLRDGEVESPGLKFQILFLEASVVWFISPSSAGWPNLVDECGPKPFRARKYPAILYDKNLINGRRVEWGIFLPEESTYPSFPYSLIANWQFIIKIFIPNFKWLYLLINASRLWCTFYIHMKRKIFCIEKTIIFT